MFRKVDLFILSTMQLSAIVADKTARWDRGWVASRGTPTLSGLLLTKSRLLEVIAFLAVLNVHS